jgi:hypothetical protein
MVTERNKARYVNMSMVVQRTGISHDQIRQIVARRLVMEPLDETDLAELRRVRRLQELGVNMQGIEVILHMRRRIEALRAELDREEGLADPGSHQRPEDRWQRLLNWTPD